MGARNLTTQSHQIPDYNTSVPAHHFTQVVLGEGIADPECNILVAGRVLAKGLEPGEGKRGCMFRHRTQSQASRVQARLRANDPPCVELPVLELGKKAGVPGPEEPDVRHVVQDHGQTLQTQAESMGKKKE